jgi:ABC-type nitrate/sulfonate/bicarbonate transport system substrate-binding protein
MMGSYIDRNLRIVKALIKGLSESIRALQSDPATAKIAIRAALRTDDAETVDYALQRSIRVLDPRPFPTAAGIQTVLDEFSREIKVKTGKFEDFVDMRALRELEKEGYFK